MVEVEELDQVEQQQDPPSKSKLLYDAVSKKYDLGTYDEFSKKLQDPSKRKALYDHVGKEFDLGTYDDFESKVVVKKKDIGGTESISKVQSISPTKWEDNVLNPASQFATSPTQPKEVKPTKAKAPFSE